VHVIDSTTIRFFELGALADDDHLIAVVRLALDQVADLEALTGEE
jgi:hypothetical protein